MKPGSRIAHFEVLGLIGAGGMGEVYRAHDTRLDRDVAIKVLLAKFASDHERLRRFEIEARAVAALSHPNVLAVHEVGTHEGSPFLVTELLEGESLQDRLRAGALPVRKAVETAVQIAKGLEAAHEKGIIHRDLTPSNVFVTNDGQVKILDFGLAKLIAPRNLAELAQATTVVEATEAGTILGTVNYMSPEQARGHSLDQRTDIFSFGCVLYQMLTGRQPFARETAAETLAAILHEDPPARVRTVRPKGWAGLQQIVDRCLQKDRELRYPSAGEVYRDLVACQQQLALSDVGLKATLRQARFAVPAAVVLLALVGAGSWFWVRSSRIAWAVNVALPEIEKLADHRDCAAAYALVKRADRYIGGNAKLAELSHAVSIPVSVQTNVPGVEVRLKEYPAVDGDWRLLGLSPLKDVTVARGLKRWRLSKPGFRTVEAARSPDLDGPTLSFVLDEEAKIPEGMVRVPAAVGFSFLFLTGLDHLAAPALDDFFIDTYEVTNRQFAAFVAAGGYRKPEFWKHPFRKNGTVLTWQDAVAEFRDSTGQPGPATWEFGSFPTGQGDLPVAGVSWYEAAAYAEFVGKSLPSIYHWSRAAWTNAGFQDISAVVRLSNFGGQAVARGGVFPGANPYGTYDLAGNVKEWCWNAAEAGDSRRYILGGAWNEPVYMFNDPDAQPPMSRLATYGFRCVKYLSSVPAALLGVAESARRNYSTEVPVGDDGFRIYRSFYSFDRTKLEPVVEPADDGSEYWKVEKITVNEAYGGERLIVYLFLPRAGRPPYQTVVFFPGASALRSRSFRKSAQIAAIDFIVRSGRAVAYPVYKSTYERGDGLLSDRPNLSSAYRDHVVQWYKDFARTVDYLETRPDLDTRKLGYFGLSWGAAMGPIVLAQDGRVGAAVLACGGFWQQRGRPEVEQIAFAQRVKVPVLMLNGKYDFVFPVETSQLPMFRFLQTPEQDKSHLLFESGHSIPRKELVTETLRWFDRYLGPSR